MAQATLLKDSSGFDDIAGASLASGEVIQLPDGRAGVVLSLAALVSGDPVEFATEGQFTVAKTASVVILKGAPLYWDRSANTATPLLAATGADFFLGTAVDDETSSATTVKVNLNVKPNYTIDLLRDPGDPSVVANGTVTMYPGCIRLLFSTATEAQEASVLSRYSCPVTIPFIVEGRFEIVDNGTAGALDFNIGVANGTNADCDSITESCFLHIDGNALHILAESDDGSTEVAATDTTVDYAEDTYVDFAIDARDLTDIQIYVNGVLMLTASVFKLNAATGPLMLLAHLEKSSDATPGEVRVVKLALRAMDQE